MSNRDEDEATPAAPYRIVNQRPGASPIIFASPHSGRHYPRELLDAAKIGRGAIRRSEDAYVDKLLISSAKLGIPLLAATYARAFLDLNREPYELDQSMFIGKLPPNANTQTARVAAGLGSVARVVADGQEIYREKIPVGQAMARIESIHKPYHAELERLLLQARRSFGFAVLLDWHSMPSAATAGRNSVDIVLGDRFASSCSPRIVEIIEREFRTLGLTVARNTPFAGGYTTEHYGRPQLGLHAIQIEISRSLYIDETKITPTPGFRILREKLGRFAACFAGLNWIELAGLLRGSVEAKLAGE